jgi:hypothetical protein
MDSNDKDHFVRTNQFYIAQVNSMEIKISELKAQIHAKDFEIDYLTSKLSTSKRDSGKSRDQHELELMLKISQQENELLKGKISEFQEVHILKSQLEQALHMKSVFEEKYRELKTKSMLDDKSSENYYEKDETIKSLQQELENCQKILEQNNEKMKDDRNEINELKQELHQKNLEIIEFKKKTSSNPGIFRADLNKDVVRNFHPTTTFTSGRSGSANNSRKVSPDIKSIKSKNLRNNLQYHSPKPSADAPLRPKIVSISLESTLQQHN